MIETSVVYHFLYFWVEETKFWGQNILMSNINEKDIVYFFI